MESQSRFVRAFGDSPYYLTLVKFAAKVDLAAQRLTRGRVGLLTLGGFPNLLLTTKGRKTGAERTVSLLYVPHGDDMIVVGSNFGQATHPAWTANLAAAGRAVVRVEGETFSVIAHPVRAEQRAELWAHVIEHWPDYTDYAARSQRELRMFVLSRESER
ncbi:nitroreductase family deazaflavin-dependent oxidoreductase [Nocardia sp. NPDC003979]